MIKFSRMNAQLKLSGFVKYAWFTLIFNVIVIIWGVFLRASKSGDGCGQHWLTCHGEVIPSAPELKTVIEFSHRIMSGIDFLIVLALVIWAFRKFEQGHQIRKFAFISFVFIITEALIGAGLVLTGNTAVALTPYRPYWAIGHLINTFALLGSLSVTAWLAGGGEFLDFKNKQRALRFFGLGIVGILLVGASGSLAALSSMLFPVASVAEGIRQDFASESHGILRLRISHPILAITISVFLIFLARWLKKQAKHNRWVGIFSNVLTILILTQLAFGTLTLLTLGPILLQLGHLFFADAIWVFFILMYAAFLGGDSQNNNLE